MADYPEQQTSPVRLGSIRQNHETVALQSKQLTTQTAE